METRPLTTALIQDGVFLITIQGNLVGENISLLKEDIIKANAAIRDESKQALNPLSVVVDLSKLSSVYDPEAMLLLADFEKKNQPFVQKTVCFGADPKIKFAGEVISALSNRKNISFFDTKEDALASLKRKPAV